MRKSLLSRTAGRAFSALLAVWMTVFAVGGVVHHHGPFPQATDHSSLSQSAHGTAQQDVCLACLASHVPVSAAVAHVVSPVLQDTEAIVSDLHGASPRSSLFAVLPSRAPPALSSQA